MSNRIHNKLVYEILPIFAERLKKEGLILSYCRLPFVFQGWIDRYHPTQFYMRPDAVFTLLDQKRILVEVVNPKDPKRFLGEFSYVKMVFSHYEDVIGALMLMPIATSEKVDEARHRLFKMAQQLLNVSWSPIGDDPRPIIATQWGGRSTQMYKQLKENLNRVLHIVAR